MTLEIDQQTAAFAKIDNRNFFLYLFPIQLLQIREKLKFYEPIKRSSTTWVFVRHRVYLREDSNSDLPLGLQLNSENQSGLKNLLVFDLTLR